MRRLVCLALVLSATATVGCSSRTTSVAPLSPPTSTIKVTLKPEKEDTARVIRPNAEGSAHRVTRLGVIEIESTGGAADSVKLVSVDVSKAISIQDPIADYEGRGVRLNYTVQNGKHYRIVINDIPDAIEHGRFIRFVIEDDNGVRRNYHLWYDKPVRFGRFSSPVLLRVSGDAGGFSLKNLAPSIATGMSFNSRNDGYSFTALNILGTVFSLPDASYALAIGPEIDLGGYVQLGYSYHFGEDDWFWVLGLRPEYLSRLFGRDQ